MAWTIEHIEGALEQSVAAWGLSGLVITRTSQGADSLTFTEANAPYDAAPTFAFDDTLKLKKDGTTVFVGRVQRPISRAQRSEERQYSIAGPWSWLEQIVYQQTWHTTNGIVATIIEENRSRIILGQDKDGNKIATGVEITAAIQWAIDNGAPITLGTIDASVTIPYQELVDVTCAELIRACLRWTPDAQSWFDYTTTTPTLHIRRRADLTPASVATSAFDADSLFSIASREDLQVPCVDLKYEKANTVDGVVYATTERDTYPELATGAEPRALVATIDLAGSAATFERQTLETEAISPTSITFWKKQLPSLRAYPDGDLAIEAVKDVDDNVLPMVVKEIDGTASSKSRFVLQGAAADWMNGADPEATVVQIALTYSGSKFPKFTKVYTATTLEGVDTSKTSFSRLVSFEADEATPTGLAEALYNALSVLHYEGSFTVIESEVSGIAHPGNTLRITGGVTAWATMDATIQQTIEDLGTGKTTVQFGPPQHLGPQDLVAQLRTNRMARASWRRKERETGQRAASGGYTQGPQKTAKQNAVIAPTGGGSTGDEVAITYCASGSPVTRTFYLKPL